MEGPQPTERRQERRRVRAVTANYLFLRALVLEARIALDADLRAGCSRSRRFANGSEGRVSNPDEMAGLTLC
jgi:hypothetical protein